MSVSKSLLVFIGLFSINNLVQSTEFVPVYMWFTSKTNEKVPALHKISQDSFKDDILERLKDDPFVIIFAEQTLSPEDFAQRDQSGETVFPYLSKLKSASYLPYVQNPIKAFKHLDEDIVEVSIDSLNKNIEIPKTNILVIDLNDAKDDEHRLDMLKRHDADISRIYKELLQKHKNVLALYTGHHTSWVAPEDVVNGRQKRSLLATEEQTGQNFTQTNNSFIYVTKVEYSNANSTNKNNTAVELSFSTTRPENSSEIILVGKSDELTLNFTFTTNTSPGYWELKAIQAAFNSTEFSLKTSVSIYAPTTFSYHCGDQEFFTADKALNVYLSNFQIQLFFDGLTGNETKFADAYDCVGFTSIPIWSGIFVTSILLLIMTFGITMMMDIRTMDKFDDAKGKTITINAE